MYRDLREWLEQVDAMGELRRIPGCDWDLEIGALAEVAGRGQDASALLFDNIKDYPEGHRVLVGMVESLKRPPSPPTCPPTSPATSSSPPGRNASTTRR